MSLEVFDEFLESPAQRDLTRSLLAGLYELRGLALIVGDPRGATAARLASRAAQHWPAPNLQLVRIEAAPTRVTMMGFGEPRVVEGGTEVALRASLRQDPDVIVLTAFESAAAQLVLTAAQTGHAVLVATNEKHVEPVFAALGGGEPTMTGSARDGVELVVELVEREGRVTLERILRRGVDGLAPLASRSGGVDRSLLPVDEVAAKPSRPPPQPRKPATVSVRRAWLPVTGEGPSRNALGTTSALRRSGESWPVCKSCNAPLQLVVQLDLAALPEALTPEPRGLVQLFVCTEGCDTTDENAPGVLAEVLRTNALVNVTIARPASHQAVAPGHIVGWRPVDEEPGSGDRERLGLAHDEDAPGPLPADKFGGWPAWAQGADWPRDDDGAPMTLLFQIVEGTAHVGGSPERWSFEEARVIPRVAPERVLDAECPRHFPSLLTAEASAFLFIGRGGRLAFCWQTG